MENGGRASISSGDSVPGFEYPFNAAARELAISGSVPRPPGCCGLLRWRRVGAMSVLLWDKGPPSRIRCVLGSCWPMLFFTMSLIVCATGFVLAGVLPRVSFVWTVGACFMITLTIGALALTGMSDPGIVPRADVESRAAQGGPVGASSRRRWLKRQRLLLGPREGYCDESQVVVREFDHFCPWTGTVIAGGNMVYFQVFLMSLCSLIGFIATVYFVALSSGAIGRHATKAGPIIGDIVSTQLSKGVPPN